MLRDSARRSPIACSAAERTVDSGAFATHIGDDVTVGHNAVIHGCTLKNRAFVGISSTVLDGAVLDQEAAHG